MPNWFKGIDEGLSTPGGVQVSLAGYYFVDSINGSDAGTGSPGQPWQTIDHAIAQLNLTSNNIIVLAEGIYYVTNATPPAGTSLSVSIIANSGKATLISDDLNIAKRLSFASGVLLRCEDIIWVGCSFAGQNQLSTGYKRCVFIAGNGVADNLNMRLNLSISGIPTIEDCVFIDVYPRISADSNKKITFINCTILRPVLCFKCESTLSHEVDIKNCDFSSVGATFEINDNVNLSLSIIENSNFRATQSNVDTPGNNIIEQNNINADPQYIGDVNELEFLINTTSPLVLNSLNGSTIGGFLIGNLVDLSSPSENNDISVGATIEIIPPPATGNIKTGIKTLNQIRKSPLILSNGLTDYRDNIPDSFNVTNIPLKRTVEITYRNTIGGLDFTKTFVYGLPMLLDDSGNSVGENNFNVFDISSNGDILNNPDRLTSSNLIDVAEIQENFILNLKLISLNLDYGDGAPDGNGGWERSGSGGSNWSPCGFNGPDELDFLAFPSGSLNRRFVDAENILNAFGRYRYSFNQVTITNEVIRFEIRESDGITVIAVSPNYGNTTTVTVVSDSLDFTTAETTFYTYMVVVSTGIGVSCRMNNDTIEDLGKP